MGNFWQTEPSCMVRFWVKEQHTIFWSEQDVALPLQYANFLNFRSSFVGVNLQQSHYTDDKLDREIYFHMLQLTFDDEL